MKFFGLYCPQCDVWVKKEDGTLLYYPDPLIALEHLKTEIKGTQKYLPQNEHIYEVTEFGQAEPKTRDQLKASDTLCPLSVAVAPNISLDSPRGWGLR